MVISKFILSTVFPSFLLVTFSYLMKKKLNYQLSLEREQLIEIKYDLKKNLEKLISQFNNKKN